MSCLEPSVQPEENEPVTGDLLRVAAGTVEEAESSSSEDDDYQEGTPQASQATVNCDWTLEEFGLLEVAVRKHTADGKTNWIAGAPKEHGRWTSQKKKATRIFNRTVWAPTLVKFTPADDKKLAAGRQDGRSWRYIGERLVPFRSAGSCQQRYYRLLKKGQAFESSEEDDEEELDELEETKPKIRSKPGSGQQQRPPPKSKLSAVGRATRGNTIIIDDSSEDERTPKPRAPTPASPLKGKRPAASASPSPTNKKPRSLDAVDWQRQIKDVEEHIDQLDRKFNQASTSEEKVQIYKELLGLRDEVCSLRAKLQRSVVEKLL